MSELNKPEAASFEARVLAFLKGGDESKLKKFKKELIGHLDAQIKIRKDEIEVLATKLSEQEEKREEQILSVNLDRIKDYNSREAYIPDYIVLIKRELDKINDLNKKVKALELEIEELKLIKSDLSL